MSFYGSDRRVSIIHWGFIGVTEGDGDSGAMVLVTFAKTKVTGPPGPVPANNYHEVANKLRAKRCNILERFDDAEGITN